MLDEVQKSELRLIRREFQARLDAVNGLYYAPDGTPLEPPPANTNEHSDTDDAMRHLNRFAFPKLRPGTGEAAVSEMLRAEACLGAGVQY